jgi:hypothetical protein
MKAFILFSLLTITICYNCLKEPNNYPCPKNSYCNKSGICACNQFYFGNNCDKILPNYNSLNTVTIGFGQSGYLGLIFGISFTFPLVLVIGLIVIYYALKGRELWEKAQIDIRIINIFRITYEESSNKCVLLFKKSLHSLSFLTLKYYCLL